MSKNGASNAILGYVGTEAMRYALSVPLVLEYESVAKRHVGGKISYTAREIDELLDFICAYGEFQNIYYLWRPILNDPKDDMVLELAVNAGCEAIVTHNAKDFTPSSRFGIVILSPQDYLAYLRDNP